jgi:DNA-binding MarR family transcriptional regulator
LTLDPGQLVDRLTRLSAAVHGRRHPSEPSQREYLALVRVCSKPEYVGVIGESLGLSKSQMSRVAGDLDRRGWVRAERDRHDRRRWRLVATDDGRAVAADYRERRAARLSPLLWHATDGDDIGRSLARLEELLAG